MAYTYGLTGTTSVGLDTAISGLTNSAKGRIATRVFDVTLGSTAIGDYARLYSGASSSGLPCLISVTTRNNTFQSNAGIRFPDGLFVALAVGTSCTVNYILEQY